MLGETSCARAAPTSAKKAAKYTTRCFTAARALAASRLEFGFQFAFDRRTLDPHVGRQAIAVRRVVFSGDQRLEITTAGGGDAEAIGADKLARHLLLDIGDGRQRHRDDLPAIGVGGAAP